MQILVAHTSDREKQLRPSVTTLTVCTYQRKETTARSKCDVDSTFTETGDRAHRLWVGMILLVLSFQAFKL